MKTSYYANLKNIDQKFNTPIAISGDEGRMVGFEGRGCRALSPYTFYRKWKAREDELESQLESGKISKATYDRLKEENQDDYIQKFYEKVLQPLDPHKVYKDLGGTAVLLCFEKPTEFCHRFLVAGWLEHHLGITIDELGHEYDKAVLANKEKLKNKLQIAIKKTKQQPLTHKINCVLQTHEDRTKN